MKQSLGQSQSQETIYPIKLLTDREKIKAYHRRMKGSARSWQRWFVGQYFTEDQNNELGLADVDIAGKGMK